MCCAAPIPLAGSAFPFVGMVTPPRGSWRDQQASGAVLSCHRMCSEYPAALVAVPCLLLITVWIFPLKRVRISLLATSDFCRSVEGLRGWDSVLFSLPCLNLIDFYLKSPMGGRTWKRIDSTPFCRVQLRLSIKTILCVRRRAILARQDYQSAMTKFGTRLPWLQSWRAFPVGVRDLFMITGFGYDWRTNHALCTNITKYLWLLSNI